MNQIDRAAIEGRLGRFATMSGDEVARWLEEQEADRAAALVAQCEERGAHYYTWSSTGCLHCGTPYAES